VREGSKQLSERKPEAVGAAAALPRQPIALDAEEIIRRPDTDVLRVAVDDPTTPACP
jgi:hypothetical protein